MVIFYLLSGPPCITVSVRDDLSVRGMRIRREPAATKGSASRLRPTRTVASNHRLEAVVTRRA